VAWRIKSWRRSGLVCGLWPLLAVVAGCQSPGGGDWLGAPPQRDDVVAIRQFPPPQPWLRDADNRITGLCLRTYFVSAATDKGVFVPGTISVRMCTLRARPGGGYERTPAHQWVFDARTAEAFRVRRQSPMGFSYGFVLRWPQELNLMGQRIEVVISYQRADGKVVEGPACHLMVDVPPGFVVSEATTGPATGSSAPQRRTAPSAKPPAGQP
jgi:hypothetical protein